MPESTIYPEEIIIYLEAPVRDFDTGVLLYERYSRNRSVLHYLKRKRDEAKLMYELHKMSKTPYLKVLNPHVKVNIQPVQPAMPAATDPPQVETDATGDDSGDATDDNEALSPPRPVSRESLCDEHKLLFDENSEMYKLQRVYHEKMKLATTDEERAAHRVEMVKLDDAIAKNWDIIDGRTTPPVAPPEKVVSEAELLHREVNNARVKLTRLLKNWKPEKLADARQQIDILIKHNASVSAATRAKLLKLHVIEANSNLVGK